jgi:hypothetical protein
LPLAGLEPSSSKTWPASGELGEKFLPLGIPDRGPLPVGRGGIPVLDRPLRASPLREQVDIARLRRDTPAVKSNHAPPVLVLGKQVADGTGQLRMSRDGLVNGLLVAPNLRRYCR